MTLKGTDPSREVSVPAAVLVLAFAGVLLAILLRAIAAVLGARGPLRGRAALVAAVAFAIGVLGLSAWIVSPAAVDSYRDLGEAIGRTLDSVRGEMVRYPLGRGILGWERLGEVLAGKEGLLEKLETVWAASLGLPASAIIVVLVALHLAAAPGVSAGGGRRGRR